MWSSWLGWRLQLCPTTVRAQSDSTASVTEIRFEFLTEHPDALTDTFKTRFSYFAFRSVRKIAKVPSEATTPCERRS
ncbi:hypothetical protein PSCLAVI8L_250017 [Pseudoclavibacter sp. 8L]|nr:hypothetical protein PSCLAVI8L_250017 [Pseudoclavibacter sp. 8L]